MMKLHRQYVSNFVVRRPLRKKDHSLIRTSIELVDIEIYLHLFMTVKGQYFFPKQIKLFGENIHCTFLYKKIRTAKPADHLNQLSLPDNS